MCSADEAEGEDDENLYRGDPEETSVRRDTAELVSSIIGDAKAPYGYMVLHELPPLETDGEKNQHILCGFETPKAMGWFQVRSTRASYRSPI